MFSPDSARPALAVVGEFLPLHGIGRLDVKVLLLSVDSDVIPPVFTAGSVASHIPAAA